MDNYEITEYDRVLATAEAMQRQGGSFVKHLGSALMVADPVNSRKIRSTFKEYFDEYLKIAEQHDWYMGDK